MDEEKRFCPSCGWKDLDGALGPHGGCPECDYEVGDGPGRLMSLAEIAADEDGMEWDDVDLGMVVRTVRNEAIEECMEEIKDTIRGLPVGSELRQPLFGALGRVRALKKGGE